MPAPCTLPARPSDHRSASGPKHHQFHRFFARLGCCGLPVFKRPMDSLMHIHKQQSQYSAEQGILQ